jgi:hypothetical protein
MSKHEVVDAYLKGRIDRREFVRRLTLAGVSTAAAIAYAQTLSTSSAAAAPASSQRAHGLMQDGSEDYTPTDSDGDGFTDEEERDCGSDPNDANSTCDNVGKPSELPGTGSGSDSGSGTRWLAPLAAAGAGAAFIARGLRRAPKSGE